MGLVGKKNVCYDRFIPVRCSMDFDIANYMLTTGNQDQQPKSEYQKLLHQHVFNGKQRILAFNNKNHDNQERQPLKLKSAKPISKKGANMMFGIPELNVDDRMHLLDWGSNGVIVIGLENDIVCLHLTDSTRSTEFAFSDDLRITCLSWSPDGKLIACGNTFGFVYLVDVASGRVVNKVWDCNAAKHGIPLTLSWKNNHILTVGGIRGKIADHDIRLGSAAPASSVYRGHKSEVLALKWSDSRCYLASGGEDKLVHIWDARMATSASHLHRFSGHTGPVKAFDWSPSHTSLLASGASWNDNTIKFWSTQSGACLSSFDTGSEVTVLMWDMDNKKQLLSSHGHGLNNQLTLWNYPSMSKLAVHSGHESRVLTMARCPDGSNVASISKDRTLRVWNVFDHVAPKKKSCQPFQNYGLIR